MYPSNDFIEKILIFDIFLEVHLKYKNLLLIYTLDIKDNLAWS